MKEILISIQPKFCELIASGKKTIEVRKIRPKIETPFKAYMYETKGQFIKSQNGACTKYGYGRGKVIGGFVCEHIDRMVHCGFCNNDIKLRFDDRYYFTEIAKEYLLKCQLTYSDLEKYSNGMDLYGWHISDLVIYDEPKDISAFRHCGDNYHFNPILSRPPQSWCYVEELR